MAEFFTPLADGLRLFIKVQPGASRARVEDVVADASGQAYLKVRVAAPPEKGKANEAVIALLAEEWGVSASQLTLAARATSRLKTFHLKADPHALALRMRQWLSAR